MSAGSDVRPPDWDGWADDVGVVPKSAGSDVRLNTERIDEMEADAERNGIYWVGAQLLFAEIRASWNDTERLRTALTRWLELGTTGALHDLLGHSARYLDCGVPVCVRERALVAQTRALAASVPSPPPAPQTEQERREGWQAGVESAVCFISACEYDDIDPRGPVFLRDEPKPHYACTEHWEAIIGILGWQVGSDDEHRPLAVPSPPCTCETFGNGVISGNDGRLPPVEGCPRHGEAT